VILSGALDRFPKLQLILGHQGEVIPFLLPKLEMAFPQERTGLERPLRDYFHQNFHFTFGGWNWASMFHATRGLAASGRPSAGLKRFRPRRQLALPWAIDSRSDWPISPDTES